ncbi:hypothetical protein QOZ80_7AG0554410 [Eleusine coracana subsp. coracana]|nr:hypothetical protein QOZ80_7AG0554410 [Eleusine coracana subsp. coracana]
MCRASVSLLSVRFPIDPHPNPRRRRSSTDQGLRTMAPPELNEDAIAEILLRLPPSEPEHLFRASLVCKPWLRVLADPDFRRRYSTLHRTPPVLGLLHARQVIGGGPPPHFNPATAAPLTPYPNYRRPLDCHHGRVLLHAVDVEWYFLVWDPATGDEHRVPDAGIDWLVYSAAVFCAVSGCDHTDCHGGPFRVVFIATEDYTDAVKAAVYSSETGSWSTPVALDTDSEAFTQHYQHAIDNGGAIGTFYTPYVQPRRGALVGDEIYFTLRWNNAIIKYDWSKNCISMIDPPSHKAYFIALMEMEDNTLGFACVEGSSLHLWSRKVRSEGAAEWMLCRVIELDGRIPGAKSKGGASVVGYAEGVDVIFVSTPVGLFTFGLKSGRVMKIDDAQVYFTVLPYMSFYTPGCGTQSSLARLRTH